MQELMNGKEYLSGYLIFITYEVYLSVDVIAYDCDYICKKGAFPAKWFGQTLNFNHLLYRHFVEEVNEIWHPQRAIINHLRYQIVLYKMTE